MASDPEDGSVRANAAIFSPVATCNNTTPQQHIKEPQYKRTSLNTTPKPDLTSVTPKKRTENSLAQSWIVLHTFGRYFAFCFSVPNRRIPLNPMDCVKIQQCVTGCKERGCEEESVRREGVRRRV